GTISLQDNAYTKMKITAVETGKADAVVIDSNGTEKVIEKAKLSNIASTGVEIAMPKADQSYDVTIELLKDSTVVAKTTKTVSSKAAAPAIGEAFADKNGIVTSTTTEKGITVKGTISLQDNAYTKMKITAVETGKADAVVIDSNGTEKVIEKAKLSNIASTGVEIAMPKADQSYDVTIELLKDSTVVAKTTKTVSSKQQ
ncbi:MAG: hypothetical protein ACTTH7_08565, partial [Treponema sp.]